MKIHKEIRIQKVPDPCEHYASRIAYAFNSYAVAALEYLSMADNAVIMYNAPSIKADKLYVAKPLSAC